MGLKHLAVAAAVALVSNGAVANDIEYFAPVSEGTSFFAALHSDDSDFIDVFTFDIAGPVRVSVALSTEGAGLANIDFESADLNGEALTLSPVGFTEDGELLAVDLMGPLVLTVTGQSGAGEGTFATYSGMLEIELIPEPGAAALNLAALGAIGALATGMLLRRHRSRA
jgi:hypothetical protein